MSGTSDQYDRLALKAIEKLKTAPPTQRIIIGIAGVPGSGKTTLVAVVCSKINLLYSQQAGAQDSSIATSLPMDGFHYSRAHLASMPHPAEATHRRGAAFTFDAEGFHALVQSLAQPIDPQRIIKVPAFDHAVKDPVADSIPIYPTSRIVLIEGNYCALRRAPWSDAAALMTELWYVDTPKDIAWDRLAKRHLISGIVKDEQEAIERARGTDELNAEV